MNRIPYASGSSVCSQRPFDAYHVASADLAPEGGVGCHGIA